MKMKLTIALLFLSSLFQLEAVVYSTINTTELLHCTFSSRHHNRILIDEGRVSKVVFPEGHIAVKMEEESGQIFLSCIGPHTPETTLSIVTEEGTVQDIELTFKNIPSEVLVLRALIEPKYEPCPCSAPSIVEDQSSYIVQEILAGRIPEGFVSNDVQNEEVKIRRCIRAIKTGKFVGPDQVVYLFEVHNKGFMSATLRETDFNFCNGKWVYLGSTSIGSGKKTFVIVSVGRE